MKQTQSPLHCICHRSVLYQTIRTEAWLREMAQNGFSLVEVQGNQYMFNRTSSHECNYFIMTPEAGTDSDAWVFHEFERVLGKRILCSGYSFFSPSHIIMVNHDVSDNQASLISYYFQYRNYRILLRFRRNAIFSSIFFILGGLVSILRFPAYVFALFPYLLVSGLLLLHHYISYFLFRKDCISLGFTKPEQKPKRPGY